MCIRWCLSNFSLYLHSCESRNLLKYGKEIPDQVGNDRMYVWELLQQFPLVGVVTNKPVILNFVTDK